MDTNQLSFFVMAGIGLMILLLDGWQQRRGTRKRGHRPGWPIHIRYLLRRTEAHLWTFTALTTYVTAIAVRNVCTSQPYQDAVAFVAIGLIFCLVVWRQRQFYRGYLRRWQQLNTVTTDRT